MLSDTRYNEAVALYNRIIAGQNNEPAIAAWAGVARKCAQAKFAFRNENADYMSYSRWQLSWLNNVDRIEFVARAQLNSLTAQ